MSNTYASSISRYLRSFPSGTPSVTMLLALDRDKPGFLIPDNGDIDKREFAAWWAASRAAERRLKKGQQP